MKITNEILLEIGFIYDKERDEFTYITVDNTLIKLFKTDKYWLYIDNQYPGHEIKDVKDILRIFYSVGFKNGAKQKVKEIKQVLGI